MKIHNSPARTTIIFGIGAGVCYFFVLSLSRWHMPYWLSIGGVLWLLQAAYSLLLVRWSEKNPVSIFFPLLLTALVIYGAWNSSIILLLAMTIFAWIRSGICFQLRLSKLMLAEIVLIGGSVLLISRFAPVSILSQAIGIVLFFLIQSLYFILFVPESTQHGKSRDTFNTACKRAESILSSR